MVLCLEFGNFIQNIAGANTFKLIFSSVASYVYNANHRILFCQRIDLVLFRKTYHYWKARTCVVGSKSFRPDIQKPRQMENAVRDI